MLLVTCLFFFFREKRHRHDLIKPQHLGPFRFRSTNWPAVKRQIVHQENNSAPK